MELCALLRFLYICTNLGEVQKRGFISRVVHKGRPIPHSQLPTVLSERNKLIPDPLSPSTPFHPVVHWASHVHLPINRSTKGSRKLTCHKPNGAPRSPRTSRSVRRSPPRRTLRPRQSRWAPPSLSPFAIRSPPCLPFALSLSLSLSERG